MGTTTHGSTRQDTGTGRGAAADSVVVASSAEDAAAAQAVRDHHAELAGALAARVDAVVGAARRHTDGAPARAALVAFLAGELMPHAAAEERTLYPVASGDPRARLLLEAMVGEHRVLEALVERLRHEDDAVLAAATATAVRELFGTHLAKENDLVLPLVAADPELSLSGALAGMHELLGGSAHDEAAHGHAAEGGAAPVAGGCGGACGCGETDEESPVLDVRSVPHAIRHATVLGAVGAVPPGGALVLVAPHDPLPLLAQIEQREPGAFSVGYDERGPEAWRLRLTRVG